MVRVIVSRRNCYDSKADMNCKETAIWKIINTIGDNRGCLGHRALELVDKMATDEDILKGMSTLELTYYFNSVIEAMKGNITEIRIFEPSMLLQLKESSDLDSREFSELMEWTMGEVYDLESGEYNGTYKEVKRFTSNLLADYEDYPSVKWVVMSEKMDRNLDWTLKNPMARLVGREEPVNTVSTFPNFYTAWETARSLKESNTVYDSIRICLMDTSNLDGQTVVDWEINY